MYSLSWEVPAARIGLQPQNFSSSSDFGVTSPSLLSTFALRIARVLSHLRWNLASNEKNGGNVGIHSLVISYVLLCWWIVGDFFQLHFLKVVVLLRGSERIWRKIERWIRFGDIQITWDGYLKWPYFKPEMPCTSHHVGYPFFKFLGCNNDAMLCKMYISPAWNMASFWGIDSSNFRVFQKILFHGGFFHMCHGQKSLNIENGHPTFQKKSFYIRRI